MNQIMLVSDKKGNHTGEYIDKDLAHTGNGKRHLAITVLLYNNKGQVLLQHRKHKIHSNIWDLTGSTHHLHRSDGTNETTEEATHRCLQKEYGIFKKIPLKILGGINYFAKDGKFCEIEHDIIVTGEYSAKIKPNRDVHYGYKWVSEKVFIADVSKSPNKYAPWAVKALDLIMKSKKNDFQIMLKDFLKVFEIYSSHYFTQKIKDSSKYPKLITKFYEDLADFTTGGKRLRAFLVYLGFMLGSSGVDHKQNRKVLPIALAVEIVHSFLLMHDDIIDRSDIRRDKPTMHKRYEKIFGNHYGISQAIVLGDIACFEAFNLVNSSDFSSDLRLSSQNRLNDVLLETAYGEALDVEYSYKRPKLADIMQVADLKTARYTFVGPLSIGGILSKCSSAQMKAIREFGLLVGIAFQLQDDFLGVFGDEKTLGKSVLSDMREGKNTLLIYKTRELATSKDKKILDKIWGKQDATLSDLLEIKNIIIKCQADKWCENENMRLTIVAKKEVAKITKNHKLQQILRQVADYVVARQK